ncbi:MAG: hypothetical protein ACRD2I_02055 [Vicinamibacterales bacterium]
MHVLSLAILGAAVTTPAAAPPTAIIEQPKNEILAVSLGKTALEDSYGGLGMVVINADGHSGTFTTNDGKASGRFDCGAAPSR